MCRNENATICRHCKGLIYQHEPATTILGFHSMSSTFNTFWSEYVENRSKYYNSMDLGLSRVLYFGSKIKNPGLENHRIYTAFFQKVDHTTLAITWWN